MPALASVGPAGLARVHPRLRAIVGFQRLNLLEIGDLGSRFDVIFCRNVMIYFDRTLQDRVHRLFFDSLVTFGVLGLGHKESIRFSPHEESFEELDSNEKLYRKVA